MFYWDNTYYFVMQNKSAILDNYELYMLAGIFPKGSLLLYAQKWQMLSRCSYMVSIFIRAMTAYL